MPLLRLPGLDISLGGPPKADQIRRLSTLQKSRIIPNYPSQLESITATPKGYHINELKRKIGRGRSSYTRAKHALETGRALELPWARIWRLGPSSRWLASDTLVVGARLLPFLWTANVNRVVAVSRRRSSLSLTWATSARHVLIGEETIQVCLERNGDVMMHLRSFSRPYAVISWITYPLVRHLQHAFARDIAHQLEVVLDET